MDAASVKKQNPIKTVILVAVMVLLVLALFYIVNNRMTPTEESAPPVSAVQSLLVRDLETNYPATPKEVVKLYCEISRCFYSEDYSEEELAELAKMSRQLFDDELVNNQSEENYLNALRREIASYRQSNRAISSYSVSASADVNYYDYDGYKWAQLVAMLSIRTSGQIEPSKERFLLRKDSTDHWKIYGWKVEEIGVTTGN